MRGGRRGKMLPPDCCSRIQIGLRRRSRRLGICHLVQSVSYGFSVEHYRLTSVGLGVPAIGEHLDSALTELFQRVANFRMFQLLSHLWIVQVEV